jgi:hypothetical protein
MAQKHTHRGLIDCRYGISLAFFRFGFHLRRWLFPIDRIHHTAHYLHLLMNSSSIFGNTNLSA